MPASASGEGSFLKLNILSLGTDERHPQAPVSTDTQTKSCQRKRGPVIRRLHPGEGRCPGRELGFTWLGIRAIPSEETIRREQRFEDSVPRFLFGALFSIGHPAGPSPVNPRDPQIRDGGHSRFPNPWLRFPIVKRQDQCDAFVGPPG